MFILNLVLIILALSFHNPSKLNYSLIFIHQNSSLSLQNPNIMQNPSSLSIKYILRLLNHLNFRTQGHLIILVMPCFEKEKIK